MHKPFYASGFLYHTATQQILLQQSNLGNNSLSAWSMFGGISHEREEAETTFRRIIYEKMKIRLKPECLFPVYDYFNNARDFIHYVFYAEVEELYTFPPLQTGTFSWFTFKSTAKLSFIDRAKQDVIVSERVINAQARDRYFALSPELQ